MDESNHLRILIVDDEPGTAKIIGMLLEEKVSAYTESAGDCASAREKLAESSYDLITMDYQLPDGDGLELLNEIRSMDDPPPVVMVTGHGDEDTAVNAFKLGAAGYVVKDPRMSVMLVEEVKSALAKRELKQAECALKESREKYRHMFENMSSGVAVYEAVDGGEDFVFVDFNKAGETIEKVDRLDIIGKSVLEVLPGIKDFGIFEVFQRVWRTGEPERFPIALYADERISGWRESNVYKLPGGEVVAIYEDVSERKEAEDFLTTVLKVLPEGLLIVDGAGNVLYQNQALAEILESGVSENSTVETLWKKVSKVNICGKDCPYPKERLPILRALHGENVAVDDIEFEVGGKRKLCEVTAIPIYGKEGEVKYAVAVTRDITEQRKAENELIGSEARLRELYDSSVEGIGIVGADGKYEYVNPRLVEMYGHESVEEFVGSYAAESYADSEDRKKILEILMEKGSVQGYEIHAKRMDGSTFWTLANVKMYKDEEGKPLRTAGFLTDITDRKLAEEELKLINAELEAYAHTISHDLKGPLAAIGVAVDLLVKEKGETGDEDTRQIINIIRKNSSIAEGRIESILKLAESGQRPSEVKEVDIGKVVGEILEVNTHQIQARGIVITVDVDMGYLVASRPQIMQLFSNLVSNAIKHNDSDRPEIRIAYLGEEFGSGHRFLVRDNGSGIPPGLLNGLFAPFNKGEDTGEVGLGLSIVRKIVGIYGGDIKVYNDNGACFEFQLRDYDVPVREAE